jgi:hypothetical protein
LVLSALLLVPEVVLLSSSLDFRQSCEMVNEWVSGHRSFLPTAYEDLVAYPLAYRRAIYSQMNDSTKAKMWATQLSKALADIHSLTPEQRDVIQHIAVHPTRDCRVHVAPSTNAAS